VRVNQLPRELQEPLAELLLSVADDKLCLGHRNADWTGLAPMLEEDIAFSSLAQDELAHASALYQMVAGLGGTTVDRLAYGRKPEEYRCAQIVELSDEFNWATALARGFFCDHFDLMRLTRLAGSAYVPLAQLASRLAAEEQIHVNHVDSWLGRLGHGGAEARGRMQEAVTALAPAAAMLWEPTEGVDKLRAAEVFPGDDAQLFRQWAGNLQRVAKASNLQLEIAPGRPGVKGGRRGVHSETFAPMLDELTEVYRVEPGATW
jgi:ring-1,2-phenylacetyl-CoA epoxidase subunit PaaC